MIGGEGIQSKSVKKQDLKVLGSKVGSQTVPNDQAISSETGQFGQTSGTGRSSATTGTGQTGSNGFNFGAGTKNRHDGSSNSSNIMTHNPVNATIHINDSYSLSITGLKNLDHLTIPPFIT